jgi:hypothetical protein
LETASQADLNADMGTDMGQDAGFRVEQIAELDADQRGFLAQVREREGIAYRVIRTFPGSVNSGAFVAEGPQGRRILKWLRTRGSLEAQFRAKTVTEALAPSGYPVPRYERIERIGAGGYVVMTELPGQSAEFRERAAEEAQAVIALNRLQRVASALPSTWPRALISGVLQGGDGYCNPDAMNAMPETARIRVAAQRLAVEYADAPTVRDEIVHKDMNPGNILVAGGAISGVVDWENTCALAIRSTTSCISGSVATAPRPAARRSGPSSRAQAIRAVSRCTPATQFLPFSAEGRLGQQVSSAHLVSRTR